MMINKALVRLFKGYYTENANSDSFSEKALLSGIIAPSNIDDEALEEAIKQYGISGDQWNATFHKSFATVANLTEEQLIAQQLIHYLTTYGFEDVGIFNHETVYIPKEKLEVPELLTDDMTMIVIKPLSKEEINLKLFTLVTSGIALSNTTVRDIETLFRNDFGQDLNLDFINNRELRNIAYDIFKKTPSDPDEFLRYVIYRVARETLKVKSRELIRIIKRHVTYYHQLDALQLFYRYVSQPNGYEKLASIFYRNKELFLAFKVPSNTDTGKELNHIINRVRRLADKYHKPVKANLLDRLTSLKSEDLTYDLLNDIMAKMCNVTIFRELRIINAINYKLNSSTDDIVYKIRNGKSYVSHFNEPDKSALHSLNFLLKSHLINRIADKVNGKKIYIPQNVEYGLPTSEKMFSGNVPCGTVVHMNCDDDLVFGIHWVNQNDERVDLDLKLFNSDTMYGWDADYRSNDLKIIFSGDMTDAPEKRGGASELFFVGKDSADYDYATVINLFTDNTEPAEYEFMIASSKSAFKNAEQQRTCTQELPFNSLFENINYMVDPNDIIMKVPGKTDCNQNGYVYGFISKTGDDLSFTFDRFSTRDQASFRSKDASIVSYIKNKCQSQLTLNELLTRAGAIIVNEKIDDIDIDLSLESLTKETFISLLA